MKYTGNSIFSSIQFSHSVESQLFVTPWTATRQVSLSITNSQSLLKHTSIELVLPSNHHILCRPLLLLPSIFPRIKVLTDESVLSIRWSKFWSFSISPSKEYLGLISFRKVKVAQLYRTRCDTMESSGPQYWSGYPFPSPEYLPNPGVESRSPVFHADSLPAEPPGKPNPLRLTGLISLLSKGLSRVFFSTTV